MRGALPPASGLLLWLTNQHRLRRAGRPSTAFSPIREAGHQPGLQAGEVSEAAAAAGESVAAMGNEVTVAAIARVQVP